MGQKEDLSGLFIEGRMLLEGAIDLLLSYSEAAEVKDGGSKMNRVHSILMEALGKLEKYEEKANI